MATQLINQFSQFELTEAEQLAGQHLSISQLQVLQNLLADISIEKTNLTYDAHNHQGWLQSEAELTGKIGMLKYIIECSHAATEAILNRSTDSND